MFGLFKKKYNSRNLISFVEDENGIISTYFDSSNLKKIKGRVILQSELYRAADGLLVKKLKTTDHMDIFTAVDDMSVQLKSAMGFSGGHINHTTDLPITEQLTNSMPAFLSYIKSKHEGAFKDNFTTSEQHLDKAIEIDNSFAVAASQYAFFLLNQTRIEEGLKMIKLAKKHNYRLTDSSKFHLASIEALFSAKPSDALSIVSQWIELYPDDAEAWLMKYWLHRNFNERLLAIDALRKVLEIEPFGINRHLTIGTIYTSLGDIKSAYKEYEIFISKNPTNAKGHLLIGDSHRTMGEFDSAVEQYQQAKLLFTNDLTADRKLANIQLRQGNFIKAEKDIKEYLKACTIPEDQYMAWNEVANFYWIRGQREKSIHAIRKSFKKLKSFQAETSYLLSRANQAWRFAAAGFPEEGQQLIDDAKMLLDGSNGDIYRNKINISNALYIAHLGNTNKSIKLIKEVEESFSNYVGEGISDYVSMFRGIIHFKGKNYEESTKHMALFLENHPIGQTEMKSIMGESLYEIGQINSAKNTFEQILVEFPSHPFANFGMAKVEMELENPEVAVAYLDKALKGWERADSTFQPAVKAREMALKLKSI
jgi:tetratricopeptide (TPR) repeat protein